MTSTVLYNSTRGGFPGGAGAPHLVKSEVERVDDHLHDRVVRVQPRVDSTQPQSMQYTRKPKKRVTPAPSVDAVRLENLALLERLRRIRAGKHHTATQPPVIPSPVKPRSRKRKNQKAKPSPRLLAERRKREQAILDGNARMAAMLSTCKPSYDTRKWQAEYSTHLGHLRLACRDTEGRGFVPEIRSPAAQAQAEAQAQVEDIALAAPVGTPPVAASPKRTRRHPRRVWGTPRSPGRRPSPKRPGKPPRPSPPTKPAMSTRPSAASVHPQPNGLRSSVGSLATVDASPKQQNLRMKHSRFRFKGDPNIQPSAPMPPHKRPPPLMRGPSGRSAAVLSTASSRRLVGVNKPLSSSPSSVSAFHRDRHRSTRRMLLDPGHIHGELTVKVVDAADVCSDEGGMVYRPFVRLVFVGQNTDPHTGHVVGTGDAEASSGHATMGGRNPRWSSGDARNTLTFPYSVAPGVPAILVVEACEATHGRNTVFGSGGLDLIAVLPTTVTGRPINVELLDETGQQPRGRLTLSVSTKLQRVKAGARPNLMTRQASMVGARAKSRTTTSRGSVRSRARSPFTMRAGSRAGSQLGSRGPSPLTSPQSSPVQSLASTTSTPSGSPVIAARAPGGGSPTAIPAKAAALRPPSSTTLSRWSLKPAPPPRRQPEPAPPAEAAPSVAPTPIKVAPKAQAGPLPTPASPVSSDSDHYSEVSEETEAYSADDFEEPEPTSKAWLANGKPNSKPNSKPNGVMSSPPWMTSGLMGAGRVGMRPPRSPPAGAVGLRPTVSPPAAVRPSPSPPKVVTTTLSPPSSSLPSPAGGGVLHVTVLSAAGLIPVAFKAQEPYVRLYLRTSGGDAVAEARTGVVQGTTVSWSSTSGAMQSLRFPAGTRAGAAFSLLVEVWDRSAVGADVMIGSAVVDVASLVGRSASKDVRLGLSRDGGYGGQHGHIKLALSSGQWGPASRAHSSNGTTPTTTPTAAGRPSSTWSLRSVAGNDAVASAALLPEPEPLGRASSRLTTNSSNRSLASGRLSAANLSRRNSALSVGAHILSAPKLPFGRAVGSDSSLSSDSGTDTEETDDDEYADDFEAA